MTQETDRRIESLERKFNIIKIFGLITIVSILLLIALVLINVNKGRDYGVLKCRGLITSNITLVDGNNEWHGNIGISNLSKYRGIGISMGKEGGNGLRICVGDGFELFDMWSEYGKHYGFRIMRHESSGVSLMLQALGEDKPQIMLLNEKGDVLWSAQ